MDSPSPEVPAVGAGRTGVRPTALLVLLTVTVVATLQLTIRSDPAGAATTPNRATATTTPANDTGDPPPGVLSVEPDVVDDGDGTDDTDPPSTTPPAPSDPEPAPDPEPDEEKDAPERTSTPPRVRDSSIPLISVVLAALILGAVTVALVARRRTHPTPPPPVTRTWNEPVWPPAQPTTSPPPVVASGVGSAAPVAPRPDHVTEPATTEDVSLRTLELLVELGRALIDAGDAVGHIEESLHRVARVHRVEGLGLVVLPTSLVVSVAGTSGPVSRVVPAGASTLRLDQVDDVLALVDRLCDGELGVDDGLSELRRVREAPPPFTPAQVLGGYVLATAGLALVLRASWRELLLAMALGGVIGLLRLRTSHLPRAYQAFWPLLAAAIVSATVFATARWVDALIPFPALVAPLITFLPGALLTISVLELTSGQIVAGSARLASGATQLILLAIGLIAGARLVGLPSGSLREVSEGTLTEVGPWVGVALFGLGIAGFNGARREATAWMLLVLYVAYAGQVIGGLFFGSELSGFFGALAMTPVAELAARSRTGPAALVSSLPGFWLLVPGALGLEGVTRILGDQGIAGTTALVTTMTSMIGISLGILLGLAVAGSLRHLELSRSTRSS